MPLTIDDQIIALVDASGSFLDIRSGSTVNTLSQSMFLVGGVSGSTAHFLKMDSGGALFVTGSFAISGGAISSVVHQGNSGTLEQPWPVLLVSGGAQTGIPASPISVTGSLAVSNLTGSVLTVQFGVPGGGLALPKMINLSFNKSDGALVANTFKRVITYSIPSGFNGYVIRFTSFQNEAAQSRLVTETNMCQLNINTNVFTAGTPYTSPQFTSVAQAEVTTALAAGAGNVVITVTYTNELDVVGRTGTITIPKGSAIGTRWDLVFQTGDLGARSIQNLSAAPTQVGIVKVLGLLQLASHQNLSTTTQNETSFAPGAITFPSGTILGVEYSGGTVSKTRLFDALIQLVV